MSLQPTDKMPWGEHKGKQVSELPDKYILGIYHQYKRSAPNKRGAFGADIVKYVEEHRKEILK